MATKILPTRLEETPQTVAVRYLRAIRKALDSFVRRTANLDEQIAEHEQQLKVLKQRREKAKPRISQLARRFRDFAETYRDEFLKGRRTKQIETEVGQFGWANNPEALVFTNEDAVIRSLIKQERFDLLRIEVKRKETSAALKAGEVKIPSAKVVCRERFVISTSDLPAVTVCEDDPVRVGKEELGA